LEAVDAEEGVAQPRVDARLTHALPRDEQRGRGFALLPEAKGRAVGPRVSRGEAPGDATRVDAPRRERQATAVAQLADAGRAQPGGLRQLHGQLLPDRAQCERACAVRAPDPRV